MAAPSVPLGEFSETVAGGWGVPYQPFGCPRCGQAFLAPPQWEGRLCPHCHVAPLAAQPARLRAEPPEQVLPFQQAPAQVSAALERFTKGVWLASDDFSAQTLRSRLSAIYWPMWLVDGCVTGAWKGEVGFDYQVKSSQESYAGGGWQSRAVIETRVRWEPRQGAIERAYANLPVPAVSDEAHLLALTGEPPAQLVQAYSPAALHGAGLRIPDLDPQTCWPAAEGALRRAAGAECQQASAGQHLRDFAVQVQYDRLNWTQRLLPLYVTFYQDDEGHAVPVYVNGATGQVGGKRLSSPKKGLRWAGLILLAALIFFVLALLTAALAARLPQVAQMGPLLWLLGFLTAACAAVPAMYPLMWNRKQ